MSRSIIDVPLVWWRSTVADWQVDWRTQSAGQDAGGGEQIVTAGFPRLRSRMALAVPPEAVGHWRSLAMLGEGRKNAFRVRMVDPLTQPPRGGGPWREEWRAVLSGQYVEPRPQAPAVGAVSAGATSLVVDERGLVQPVRVGTWLSYLDWPFVVVSRSGVGASVTLGVRLLRVAIPNGGQIDVIARGIFVMAEDGGGQPAYSAADPVARPEFDLLEWITR